MKKDVRPATKKDFDELKTPAVKKLLKPILSPLEQAVILHSSQPFKFKIDGALVYVSRHASKQILLNLTYKLRFVTHLINKERLSASIPFALRETFYNPAEVMSLHPRLRNRLCALKCYTLFDIMQKGKKYFSVHKFSVQSIKTIQARFSKHNCSNLFK